MYRPLYMGVEMEYTQEKIHELVEKQRAFFLTGTTLDISNGLGQNRYNARLNSDPEIVLYKLSAY